MSEPITPVQELVSLRGEVTELRAKVEKAEAEKTKAEADKATAEKLMAEADARANMLHTALESHKDVIAKADGAIADLTAKLTASETAKAEAEKAHAKLAADVARNPAFADASAGRKPVAEPNTTAKNQMTLDDFNALSPADKMAFSINGGKLIEG